jgi:uncharacterized membrane protein
MNDDTGLMTSGAAPPAPRRCATERGWAWLAEGWQFFRRAPGPWVGLVAALFAINIVGSLVPVIGPLALTVLGPVFVGGIMLGCAELAGGGRLRFAHLFAGFRSHTGSLATIGAFTLLASFAVMLVVGLVLTLLFGLGGGFDAFAGDASPGAALPVAGGLLGALVFVLGLLPVYMAVWFAPALVVLAGCPPVAALKASFFACTRNLGALTLYGVVLMFFAILASIPLALGWLVLGPVVSASIYAAYVDIFAPPH